MLFLGLIDIRLSVNDDDATNQTGWNHEQSEARLRISNEPKGNTS